MPTTPEDARDPPTAHKGPYGSVVFAVAPDGSCPAKEFWDALLQSAQTKFMALFMKITQDPNLHLRNREQFKQVKGDLWEFKCNSIQMRMFTFRHENRWYLVHGFKGKKENKLPPREVKRAFNAMKDAKRALRNRNRGVRIN